MMLCIDGTDINRLYLARAEEVDGGWRMAQQEDFFVSPETYLATIAEFLGDDRPEAIAVCPGPGSATALRANLAIANTLAFAWNIPIMPFPSPDMSFAPLLPSQGASGRSVWSPAAVRLSRTSPRSSEGEVQRHPGEAQRVVLPKYANDPHITTSTRDHLRRQG